MRDDEGNHDRLLRLSVSPPPPALALRIIEKTSHRPREVMTFRDRLRFVFDYDILLPQPFLAFAVAAIIGFVAGLSVDPYAIISPQFSAEELGVYLLIEDTLNSGEFL